MKLLLNIILFQLGWFACVLGGAHGLGWVGVGFAALVIVWHLYSTSNHFMEIRLIIVAAAIGLVFDAIPVMMAWIQFAPMPYWSNALAPPWMLALWTMLATTLNISLAWLKPRLPIAALLGAISGPVAYLSGAKLGAMQIIAMPQAITYLAVGWGLAMWFLVKLSNCKSSKNLGTI